ncbi:hypothetical protein NM952_09370 [Pasteurella multocida subsp. multocida]|uniref:hypothetical protein n=1 Tax=Pasteurella multocida TaxID=747 RepID=UPI00086AB6AC|nr:hypothetical protein [Pasteurella multocida]MDA5609345.1 hypothetical protein [Pasteurella multocida subsp. multocida]MDA5616866.1 hypothetical protein [Pasteurella multocida]MDA5618803.1 hypothetical protein [Pasteurella multocida subsp. multocida]MDA5626882.1 hypothetical protein [Pasteurella multocida]ODS43155.1 hypothetical protein BGK37_12595 [Pasteurella multocida]
MKIENFVLTHSSTARTISEFQKKEIQQAILSAIANGCYHDGLEEKACKAVCFINKFNDGKKESKLINKETGEVIEIKLNNA